MHNMCNKELETNINIFCLIYIISKYTTKLEPYFDTEPEFGTIYNNNISLETMLLTKYKLS